MTFGSLINWGGFGKTPVAFTPIERYHGGHGWEHKSHGHGHKSGGKGGGSAALSALALLAFLFLLNVMQQSLQDNNSTATPIPGTTTLLLREGQQPVILNVNEETENQVSQNSRKLDISSSSKSAKKISKKGDTDQR